MEACLKFARRYWHTQGETARTKFVAFTHSFHGRTMGALSVTWDEHYRAPFQPLIPGVSFVDADDPAALDRLVDDADRRDHRRADPGRGRRAADLAGAGAGDHRARARAPARC